MLAIPTAHQPELSASAPAVVATFASRQTDGPFNYADAFLEPMSIREEPPADEVSDDFVVL
eukprot:scaffold8382_cov38-Prasinocladus_malaysianus.AAC.1